MLLGGNWNNGANSGSRCSNWNNAPTNSNNNISSRGVSDDLRSAQVKAVRADRRWSASLSCFGEHVARSTRRRSRFGRNAGVAQRWGRSIAV